MIMRYQRVIPESEAANNNGRRTNSPSNTNWKTYKEEDEEDKVETYNNWYMKTSSTTFEGKGISSRFRSPSKTSQILQNGCNIESPNSPPTNSATNQQNLEVTVGGGENFLQWGHRKRSRCSRGVITMADDTSSSPSGVHLNPPAKIQRKLSSTIANLMPPPASLPSTSSPNGIHTGTALKSQARNLSAIPPPPRRNLEEQSRSSGGNRPISGRSRAVKKPIYSSSVSAKDEIKIIGCSHQQPNKAVVNTSDGNHLFSPLPPQQQGGCSSSVFINDDSNIARGGKLVAGDAVIGSGGGGENGKEAVQWPRIIIPLSKKEKEEDFLTMKGTKLPYRPRKRPKAIEKSIKSCYPGMWLSGIAKDRYEVIEKKPSKKQKKRRGLKGMESIESDSISE